MSDKVAGVFDSVFECTLNMITKNFEDFPEHRSGLYKMLQTINANCFPGIARYICVPLCVCAFHI